jgi:putative heme-binding domain-containing protein
MGLLRPSFPLNVLLNIMRLLRPLLLWLPLGLASLLGPVTEAWFPGPAVRAETPRLELRPGDSIAIIGNTLADRLQHDGWLETYVHARHPEYDLIFRNLGYPGDEVMLRVREDNFGSADQWLSKVKADVVLCFFGYNEALRGPDGLEAFRRELEEMIAGMLAQQYNGHSPPRLVIFSPLAHEDLGNPHLPDGNRNNVNLALYTEAMRQVCDRRQVPFIDLWTASQRWYASSDQPLTINGIHLSEVGGRFLAEEVASQLFPERASELQPSQLEVLRQAVLDRNDYWFNRYRVVDGYNVFGGRSKLEWFGQSNADVMMREMEIFDVMASNRDRRVWATARGGDLQVVDDNLPPELEVRTNKPGDLDDGRFSYRSGEEAMELMKVAEGMQVNLFACEQMFPELVNPVQMAVDPDGHLYVSVWPSYPHWNPTRPREDRILCLRDDDGDGVADRCIVFADELNSVTGFEFWGGGMLVAALPELWFLKDTTGDGRADHRVRMLQGLSSADSHHSANAMLLGPDGWLYWSRGIFNVAAIETPTQTYRSERSGVHRFNPRTFEMEFHFPIGPNPHGNVFDQWGYLFSNDGTTGTGSYVNIGKGIGNRQWFEKRVRPVAATGILSSRHFPEENQGNFLIANTIGVLGVLQHRVEYHGADIRAVEIEPILLSDDPNFRPSDLEVGADGALYVADWANALIGHMQHNMRDPNRDDRHGRIYRITATGRPLIEPVRLKGEPIAVVCQALLAPENATRYRARIELSGRPADQVETEVLAWAAGLDVADPQQAQALLECLWVFEEQRLPQPALLERVLAAAEPRVRAAAVRTLSHWPQGVPQWQRLLESSAVDDSPLVRAEVVKAAVEFPVEQAAEAVLLVAGQPLDDELEAVLAYAVKSLQLEEWLRGAIDRQQLLSPAALAYAYRHARPEELAKLPPSVDTYLAILKRADVPVALVASTLDGLARLQGADPLPLALNLLEQRDRSQQSQAVLALAPWLSSQAPELLSSFRQRLAALATEAELPETRRVAYALTMVTDGAGDRAFSLAAGTDGVRDWLSAIELIPSETLRGELYPMVRSLMLGDQAAVGSGGDTASQLGVAVDYFEPNPANVSRETLAGLKPVASGVEQQIGLDTTLRRRADFYALRFRAQLLVPTSGRYRFWLASDDGSRLYLNEQLLIDNDGPHGMVEKSVEVDLAAGPQSLELNYFNASGDFGLRLEWSGPGRERGPVVGTDLQLGAGGTTLSEAAVSVLGSVPGSLSLKWEDLTSLVKSGRSRAAAVAQLRAIPADQRPAQRLVDLADNLIGYLSEMPAAWRTGPAAAEVIELVGSLADQIGGVRAEALRSRLENLDVRVIAIGTVQERMIFDKERLAIQAGRPVEFRFSNSDFMPHNFVIVAPGSLEEIGELAEATSRTADARQRQYVPVSDKVLLASRLLESNQSQSLLFEAPAEPGVYPYVCTYPGHWRRMYGALYVVADLESYQADPERYLAANPLPLRDELLQYIGRDTEWTYQELVGLVDPLPAGRSFEVGRNLFRTANCAGCHQLGGEGYPLGPNLAEMPADRQRFDYLLKSIVEPSDHIDDKYRSYRFLLDSGQVVTGQVVEQGDAWVDVLVDPLNVREPLRLSVFEIEQRAASEVSIMPAGLLNKLTQEEIIDLVAYVFAAGNAKHPMYADDPHAHHHGSHGGGHSEHDDDEHDDDEHDH